MKTLKHFLLRLIVVIVQTTGMVSLEAMEDNTTKPFVTSELVFTPNDPNYYAIIEQELNNLKKYLKEINDNAGMVEDDLGIKSKLIIKEITFTNNTKAQQIAPTLYTLFLTKIETLRSRMKLDLSKTMIWIDPDNEKYPIFNAFYLPKNPLYGLMNDGFIFHAAFIKLMSWHEGSEQYHKIEGLFDSIIAHELGHKFHQHKQNDHSKRISQEFEADRTAANYLQFPKNIISFVFLATIAGDLFDSLKKYSNLSTKAIFSIVCIISSNLIKKYPDLGTLGNCISHAQLAYNIDEAVKIFSAYLQGNFEQCEQNLCTLIYIKLISCCEQAVISCPDDYDYRDPMTHPCPRDRKAAILALIEEQK